MAWKLPFYMGVMPWPLHYLRLMHMTVMIFLWVSSAPGSNSLVEPAASCRMPTLLQSSNWRVVPPQWNEWVWLWCFSACLDCSYNCPVMMFWNLIGADNF